MSKNIEKLLILQNTDRKIARFEKESRDVPARKHQIETRVKQEKDAVTEINDAIRKKLSDQKQVELDIEAHKEKIAKLRRQQVGVKSNDEYRTIEQEIRYSESDISHHEEKQLRIMEDVEELKKEAAVREKKLKDGEAQVKGDLDVLEKRMSVVSENIAKLRQERQGLLDGIEPDWLSRYDRIFRNKGDWALVAVENGTCGGCHMKLPPQVAQDAKRGTAMVSCAYCGRLLYVSI